MSTSLLSLSLDGPYTPTLNFDFPRYKIRYHSDERISAGMEVKFQSCLGPFGIPAEWNGRIINIKKMKGKIMSMKCERYHDHEVTTHFFIIFDTKTDLSLGPSSRLSFFATISQGLRLSIR
jgi:hypothetical protein